MDSQIISVDQQSRTTEIHHYDESEKLVTIETEQDVTELIESNRAIFNLADERERWGEGRRVASIPMNVYMDLYQKGIIQDQEALRKWLNDPDNRFFRTFPGVV